MSRIKRERRNEDDAPHDDTGKSVYNDLMGGNGGVDTTLPITIKEDNQACIFLAKNFMVSKKSKHIRVRFHYVRQQQRDGVISLEYINSADNPADLFTKVLDDALFTKHRDVLVTDPPGGPCYGDDAAPAATACAMSRNHPKYGDAKQKKLKFCTTRPIWMGSTSYKRTCSRCTGRLSGRALAVL